MKFKKLEVAGFKSFADKLEIKFGQGITAIVGPNGCGKSNVADSIRWVLGEQSAKLLRGSSMQDVIFNGTEIRKSLSFCEVNLYFDNKNKELFPSLDFNEVVVSRKLYRSGESEYLLNKSVVRLKDIIDLLRDANMGKEGYSIIGQGRIDELLSSKPEDRRTIFEEAAGIAKHKAKKKEAERRLARVQEELNLAQVVVDEKAKQLEPLARQAENARKWLEFRDKLKSYEINTYIYQYDTASEAKSVIANRLKGIIEVINLRQKECDETARAYNMAMAEMNETDDILRKLREELLEISVGKEKQSGEIKLINERLGYLALQDAKLKNENLKLDGEYKMLLDYAELGQKTLQNNKNELRIKKAEEEALSEEYLRVVETITKGEDEVESHHREVVDAMNKLADIKSNMSRLLAERDALKIKIEELSARIKFNDDKLKIDEAKENSLKEQIAQIAETKDALVVERDEVISKNNESLYRLNDAAAKLDKLNEKFYTLKTRQKLIKEMQESFESFAFSVKKLLSDAKTNDKLARRMEGVVAQLIKVNEGFDTAIETALGNAVQNIVTNNEEDAKFLIEYLKQQRYGRVTFLPLTSIKPRSIDPAFNSILKAEGCFGIASELVRYDEKYAPVVSGLLGGTVVVRDMDLAVDIAKQTKYSFRIVTLDGDVIDSRGSITGGSKRSELNNIFGYDRELETLNKEITEIEAQIAELNNIRTENAAVTEKASEQIKLMRERIHDEDISLAAKSETYKKLKESNEELAKTIGNLEFEVLECSERAAVIDTDVNSVSKLENLVTSQKDYADAGGKERQQQFDTLRAERNTLHELMVNSKMAVSSLENSISNNETEIKRLQENIISVTGKIESNNEQLQENAEQNIILNKQLDALFADGGGDEDNGKSNEIRSKLDNLDEFKRAKQQAVAEFDEKRMQLVGEIQELHEKKSREDMLLLKVDTDIEAMQERILEEYNLVYEDCLQYKEENYDLNAGVAETAKLKRQMSALGNVNVDAIELSQEVFREYNELNIKKDDLVKSKMELEQIIARFNAEMLEKFTENFALIRTNFQKIFKELFDGGNADLIIMENENLLEAGIEIVAQPPSKKLQSISLLSGGERALTAIAILFAILRLKPMPFCVLDEIEAALDDANAGRFAKYLRRFSEDTQFIVITHRKPTMELADSLYGVTMEEKGVSKIVSVKLSEAVAVAEQTTA